MAGPKTKRNKANVDEFISSVTEDKKRSDSYALIKILRSITGCEAEMWGASIIGFGNYRYKYKSGKEGEWFLSGFSPRKQNMTLYVMGSSKEIEEIIAGIGKHKRSKGCLYFNRLADLDIELLKQIIHSSVERIKSNKVML